MRMWGDEVHLPAEPCVWLGGVCETRARLKRTMLELQRGVHMKGLSDKGLAYAERRYHRALSALLQHHCEEHEQAGGGPEGTERPEAAYLPAVGATPPADLVEELDGLVTKCCELYARKGMADIAEEYRNERVHLRTRIAMVVANQQRTLLDYLTENEKGGR